MSSPRIYHHIDVCDFYGEKVPFFIISGWCAAAEGEDVTLVLTDDKGAEIPCSVRWSDRFDVPKYAKRYEHCRIDCGFWLAVEQADERLRGVKRIVLKARCAGREKTIVTRSQAALNRCYARNILRYNVEYWKRSDTYTWISGWALGWKGNCEIAVMDKNNQILPAKLKRSRRIDLERHFLLDEDARPGFQLQIENRLINDPELTLVLRIGKHQKKQVIHTDQAKKKGLTSEVSKKLLDTERWKRAYRFYRKNGTKATIHRILHGPAAVGPDYDKWFKAQRITDEALEEQKKLAAELPLQPKISICIPLFNTQKPFLKALMDSILGQSYTNWELCLADGSTLDEVGEIIQADYASDPRVIYQRLDENHGIAGNTNLALKMASGDYVMLSDHDDILEKDALYEIVRAINGDPALDILYTDEDLTDETGEKFYSPRFKPDFNEDFLTSINYICHIFLVRKAIMDEVGGFREAMDGAQDWDMILRCCEKTQHIGHIPKVLYHWRAYDESTAGNPESKMYAIESGRRALAEYFSHKGQEVSLEYTDIFIMFRPVIKVEGTPKVSIIICSKDQKETLQTCVESILSKSTYGNYEVIIVENNSTEPETFRYYEELQKRDAHVRVVTWQGEGPFNYSAVNNFGAENASGDYYILLNNDTQVITPDWIERMLGHCQRKDTGIVGAKLYYQDQTVQHCGVVIGVGGFAGHILTGQMRGDVGYFGRLQAVQECSAVTAACMMIRKDVFEAAGGLDTGFRVALNDIDLCLKVRELGYRIVVNPGVELFHYESKSRGYEDESPEKKERFKTEIRRFREKWGSVIAAGDPYYNPQMTLMYGDCRIRGEGEHFDIIDEIESDIRAEQAGG